MNERLTRKEIIDLRLLDAGWDVNDRSKVGIEYFFKDKQQIDETQPAYGERQFCDYVLLGKDGKTLAVVEAKKTSVDAAIGREEAKQYCQKIQKEKGGELPFCFYTNGHDIYFWDIGNYPPRQVHGFPTRDDLERYRNIRRSRRNLIGELINDKIAGRDFQIQAIRSVVEGIEKKRRKFLLVMATGTGKTRTCIALVDALMRAGWVERTLFLVDRIALQSQTLDAFKEHLPNETRWPSMEGEEMVAGRRIYVSTYQTMLNNIQRPDNPLSPHFFDLVVVDECHRSVYNTYKEILKYFNTITLGLTATPTNAIDHNTFELFDVEDGVPTFAYSYEDAVSHIPPYLSDFQVMKLVTKFQEDGINERTIPWEEQQKLILQGKEVEEINYEGSELEKKVTNKGTNALIIREFMEVCVKDDNGVLPGKTIFFCISKDHARRMEKIFDAFYPEHAGELTKVIVSEDPKVHGKGGLLDQFINNDMPRIALSVDMLDTGIDVREITNLVFAKPVFSYTKFWQMIGRGTRLLEPDKAKPWCTKKEGFLILDCWDNFEYFKVSPKGKDLKPQIPLPVRLFGARLDKIEMAIEMGEAAISKKEISKLIIQIEQLPKNSVTILEAKSELQRLDDPAFFATMTSSKMTFLRNFVKPLFRTVSNTDFKAMRFEKDILEIGTAWLSKDQEKFEALKASIVEIIGELPLNVNTVAKEETLIRAAQTNHFWATITEDKLDELIEKLAPLMMFRNRAMPSTLDELDIKDMLHRKEMVEFGPQHQAMSIAKYRELVEQKIKELVDANPILRKLKEGQSINDNEAEQLAEALHEEHPHITLDLLRRVYQHRKAALTQFVKHILGIEKLESFPETVSNAFGAFIGQHTYLDSRQLQFLGLLRDYIIAHGELTKRNLIESPFTMIHSEGIRGVFDAKEIEEIFEMAKQLTAA